MNREKSKKIHTSLDGNFCSYDCAFIQRKSHELKCCKYMKSLLATQAGVVRLKACQDQHSVGSTRSEVC